MSRALCWILAAMLVTGCTTRLIVDHPIAVPAGLTEAEIGLAIREAMEGTRRLRGLPDFQYRTDPGYTRGEWSLEDPAPGFYKAVLRVDAYGRHMPVHRVIKVGIWYAAGEVRTRIVSASGMKFDGDRVHKTALKWQEGLDARIRSELAWAAQSKQQRPG